MFIFCLILSGITLCSAACGPDGTRVTLDDDYFNITSSNIEFDENTFKGAKSSDVGFHISGIASRPKFTVTRLCFRVKCASKVFYVTNGPPKEITCEMVNGMEICSEKIFSSVSATAIVEDPCRWYRFCIDSLPISIGVNLQFTYIPGCKCKAIRGKKLIVKACVEN